MFDSIITILTTIAVAFHAMVGCCAHHVHACDSREPGVVDLVGMAAVETHNHCSHSHHHHGQDEDRNLLGDELADDCGHDRDDGGHHKCEEGDCNFTSVQRSDELQLMLTFSMWFQTLGDAAHADAMDGLDALKLAADSPPDSLSNSGTARAISQVWRL